MSCTFWLRRKKYVAKQHEQERLKAEQAEAARKAEAERQAAEKAAEVAKRAAEKKAAKKAVAEDDNA